MNKYSFNLSEIPEEWSVIRCGSFFSKKNIKNTEGEVNLSVYRDYGVIPRNSRDDNHNRVSEDISNYKLVTPGDFVLNKMKGWQGSLGVSDYRGIVSPAYTVMEPVQEIHNRYFHYLLRSEIYRQIYESLSYGVRIGQWELRYHDFKTIPSLYPPIKEQKLIARYLDKKTEQIDLLIEKIKKKIELLKEQRTSLVNQCITKGLDPNVEMKDSGAEYIGQIPKHWNLTKLKYLSNKSVQYGLNIESDFYNDSGVRLLRITDINQDGSLKETGCVYLDSSDVPSEYYLNQGDVLFARSGSVGKSTLINDNNPLMSFAGYLVRFSFDDYGISKFVKWMAESGFYWKWIYLQSIQSTIPNVNGEKYSNLIFPIPSIEELKLITRYLDKKTEQLDIFIEKNQKKIELLKEYRQSLISSVVTGKVRITENML